MKKSPSEKSANKEPPANVGESPHARDVDVRSKVSAEDDRVEASETAKDGDKNEKEKPLFDTRPNKIQPLHNHQTQIENHEDECICNRRFSGVPVSQLINPEGNDLQRVVVYFYNRKGDSRVQLYIPDVQKQHYIPDLPLDDFDLLQPLNSDVLLNLFADSSYSVTKTFFDTRPDYTTKIVQPDIDEYRVSFNQLIWSQPRAFDTLVKVVQSRLTNPSRTKLLTVLHSLGLSWDQLVDKLKENHDSDNIHDNGQDVVSPPEPHEHPVHDDYSIDVEPSDINYQINNNVEAVRSDEDIFSPVQREPLVDHFLPALEENELVYPLESNAPVPVSPKDYPEYSEPVLPPQGEEGSYLEPYDNTLQYLPSRDHLSPSLSEPVSLPPYKLQSESQVSYIEYPELRPDGEPENQIYPTGSSPIINEEQVMPTAIPVPEYHDYIFPTDTLPYYEPSDTVTYGPSFDSDPKQSLHVETPTRDRPYPTTPVPDYTFEYEDDSVEVVPTGQPQYNENKYNGVHPYPNENSLSPNEINPAGEQITDPVNPNIPDSADSWKDLNSFPHTFPDYGNTVRPFNPQEGPSYIEPSYYEYPDEPTSKIPLGPQDYYPQDYDQPSNRLNDQSPFYLPQKPSDLRPPYAVNTEYSGQRNVVMTDQLRNFLLQPQRYVMCVYSKVILHRVYHPT